ncbi:MAG: TonB-dependent receptor [Bacteroidales bacterium]|nr:TonB-dependent receptor [Bacteroidales bacterium]
MKKSLITILLGVCAYGASAQQVDTIKTLEAVTISAQPLPGISKIAGPENGNIISSGELFRAACCNLGESFLANPSVDVNYNDAATGAKQIQLLGLSGRYVQMLVENLPLSAGPATPYYLGFVPGSWMKSISVSKGASSVKNGIQSVTGQINVEYLKPEDPENVMINLYGSSMLKGEANVVVNRKLGKHLTTELLGHYEHDFAHHDDNNDGWHDSPTVKQLNIGNRWHYMKGRYIFHGGLGVLDEHRTGGQLEDFSPKPYRVRVNNRQYSAYMKHAYVLNAEHNTNVALMTNVTRHEMGARFGLDSLNVNMNDWNAQLMLEHDFNDMHSISTGLSLLINDYDDWLKDTVAQALQSAETDVIPGLYAQYTFKPTYKFTAMAGLRADRSKEYGIFATPRLHLKWMPNDVVTLRGSSGLGYRKPFALSEYHYLLSSGRTLNIENNLEMEQAWNSGISASFYIHVSQERLLMLNAEYYYTHFFQQLVVDYDSDPASISLHNLNGRSYSQTLQLDASYSPLDVLDVTAAIRFNDVRSTYGGKLKEAPLVSRYKGLLTASWKPFMGLWKFDVTLQLNGPGRMPTPYLQADGTPSWDENFPAYPQLNMQVTREFRHLSLYLGGENLNNYRQPEPVLNAVNPWSPTFEPTLIWGPVNGIMLYAGIRMNLKNSQ